MKFLVRHPRNPRRLRSDDEANKKVYGNKLNAIEMREVHVNAAGEGKELVDLLQTASPKHTL